MELDYFEIGKRLARRRKDLGLKLPPKITETMYRNLAQFVREQA